jgi:hypothetical protein
MRNIGKYRSAVTGKFVRSSEGSGVSSSRQSATHARSLASASLKRASHKKS